MRSIYKLMAGFPSSTVVVNEQAEGQLGCFCLTEKLAGPSAEYGADNRGFSSSVEADYCRT